jgi:hypothetical protein
MSRAIVRVEVTPEERRALHALSERQCIPISALLRPLVKRILEPTPAVKTTRKQR